jgi:hypothetical protein
MRHKFASTLLIASVFVWGIRCGGQVFNELIKMGNINNRRINGRF